MTRCPAPLLGMRTLQQPKKKQKEYRAGRIRPKIQKEYRAERIYDIKSTIL